MTIRTLSLILAVALLLLPVAPALALDGADGISAAAGLVGRLSARPSVAPAADIDELVAMQEAVERIHVEEDVGRYIVAIVEATRGHDQVLVGASPRGSLAIMKMARARALRR